MRAARYSAPLFTSPQISRAALLLLRNLSPVWVTLLAVVAADAIWIACSSFSLDWHGTLPVFGILALLVFLALFYCHVRPDDRIWCLLEAFIQWVLFGPAIVILSYLLMSLRRPLVDTQLIAVDHMLGFDWRAHIYWLLAHPWLDKPLRLIYESMIPQITVAWIVLSARQQLVNMRHFMLSVMLGSAICCLVGGLLPAAGGYFYYHDSKLALMHPLGAGVHESDFFSVRSGHLRTIVLDKVQGIIKFPSFHTCAGVLLIYAAWRQPILWFIYLPLNIIMIFSVLGQGGHYLSDVIGGVLAAAAAIALGWRMLKPEKR